MSSQPHKHAAILFLIFLTTWAVAQADVTGQSWSDVTVVDAHGWRLEGVSISWIDDGTTLQIRRKDGATKTIKPDEIQHIYDAQGVEITAEVGLARTGTSAGTPTGQADQKLTSDLAAVKSGQGAVLESADSAAIRRSSSCEARATCSMLVPLFLHQATWAAIPSSPRFTRRRNGSATGSSTRPSRRYLSALHM